MGERLEELVSDWELEEILDELEGGAKRENVAFQHGIPASSIPRDAHKYRMRLEERERKRKERERQKEEERHQRRLERERRLRRDREERERMEAERAQVFSFKSGKPFDKYEKVFVRDNYPNHGKNWQGWDILGRPYSDVARVARRMHVKKRKRGNQRG